MGIGLIWKERKICGLAHCLLPEDTSQKFVFGGRYASQAVRSLLIKMRVNPDKIKEIDAIVAGGGNLTGKDLSASEHIGTMNLDIAIRELKAAGIRLIHLEKGGIDGRKVSINSVTGAFKISKIPRIAGAG